MLFESQCHKTVDSINEQSGQGRVIKSELKERQVWWRRGPVKKSVWSGYLGGEWKQKAWISLIREHANSIFNSLYFILGFFFFSFLLCCLIGGFIYPFNIFSFFLYTLKHSMNLFQYIIECQLYSRHCAGLWPHTLDAFTLALFSCPCLANLGLIEVLICTWLNEEVQTLSHLPPFLLLLSLSSSRCLCWYCSFYLCL